MGDEKSYLPLVDFIWGSVCMVVAVYTVLGNVLVLKAFWRLKRKTISDVIFINLAVTDIISGLDALIAGVILLNQRKWFDYGVWDDIVNYFAAMTWNGLSVSTPLMLALASLGRMLAVYVPLSYERLFSYNIVVIGLSVSWGLGGIAATAGLYKGGTIEMYTDWGYADYLISETYSEMESRLIYLFAFALPIMLSCCVLVSFNIAVAGKLLCGGTLLGSFQHLLINLREITSRSIARSETEQEAEVDAQSLQSPSVSFNTNTTNRSVSVVSLPANLKRPLKRSKSVSNSKHRKQKEQQVIVLTILFSLNYLLCYLVIIHYYIAAALSPGQFMEFYKPITQNDPIRVTYLFEWYYCSMFLSSAFNPLIHFLCNSKIRSASIEIFKCARKLFSRCT